MLHDNTDLLGDTTMLHLYVRCKFIIRDRIDLYKPPVSALMTQVSRQTVIRFLTATM